MITLETIDVFHTVEASVFGHFRAVSSKSLKGFSAAHLVHFRGGEGDQPVKVAADLVLPLGRGLLGAADAAAADRSAANRLSNKHRVDYQLFFCLGLEKSCQCCLATTSFPFPS